MNKKIISLLTLLLLGPWRIDAAPPSADADHLLFIPKNSRGPLAVIVALPGKNVRAKDDQANWKFMAGKRNCVLVNMDVDYATIKNDSDLERFHERILKIVHTIPQKEARIDKKRIYLVGTSMGGMMAISLALRHPTDFLAVSVVCGSRLRFGAERFLANAKGQHIYLAHGEKDNVVPIGDFEQTKDALVSNGAVVTFDVYPGAGHILTGAYKKAAESLNQ